MSSERTRKTVSVRCLFTGVLPQLQVCELFRFDKDVVVKWPPVTTLKVHHRMRQRCRGSRRRQSRQTNLIFKPRSDRNELQPMRARFGKLETNQISQGAGLTQSSGREKVSVTKRVSDECQRPARALYLYTEITSSRWGFHGGFALRFIPLKDIFRQRSWQSWSSCFWGKSECAAMSRLTGMAEAKEEKIACVFALKACFLTWFWINKLA